MEWDQFSKPPEKNPLTREEAIMAAWTAEAMCLPETELFKAQYRASSMPICGHYIEVADGTYVTEKGQKGFYTGIGTALHEYLQSKFPLTKNGPKIFGNWRCRNPRCRHMHMWCVNPDSCEECGTAQPEYREVEVKYRGLISMHIDLLIALPNGNFWLNDWKTCSSFALENPRIVGLPYAKNVAQVETYCVALLKEKGIRVTHAFLDYTLRGEPEDDPAKPKNRPYGIKITNAVLIGRKQQMDRIVAEKQALTNFRNNRTLENLKTFDALRPCHSQSDYADNRYGQQPYFQYHENGCPFANEKGCFKTGLSEPARILARRK